MALVLLGDSVFDSGAYTGGGPDVISHLRGLLPGGWKGTLSAVDDVIEERRRGRRARLEILALLNRPPSGR